MKYFETRSMEEAERIVKKSQIKASKILKTALRRGSPVETTYIYISYKGKTTEFDGTTYDFWELCESVIGWSPLISSFYGFYGHGYFPSKMIPYNYAHVYAMMMESAFKIAKVEAEKKINNKYNTQLYKRVGSRFVKIYKEQE